MAPETLEFTHRRGLTVVASILAIFWGLLCLMILSIMLWPANLSDAVATIAIAAFLSCLLVVALYWGLFRLFTKIRVDETGIERICFGKTTRMDFVSVERIELGRRWPDAWIDIHTPKAAVRITSDLTDYAQLFDMLFDRFPHLRRHEEVTLPYTVWLPRFYSPLFVASGLCYLTAGIILLLVTPQPRSGRYREY